MVCSTRSDPSSRRQAQRAAILLMSVAAATVPGYANPESEDFPCPIEKPPLVGEIREPASGYERACLSPNDPYYVDRGDSHGISRFPPWLKDAEWIRTTNTADKDETSKEFLEFELREDAVVYVGYDSRVFSGRLSPPDWLKDHYDDTHCILDITEPDPLQEFRLFRRIFRSEEAVPPGMPRHTVVLGGNKAPGAKFGNVGGSNYLVAVAALEPGQGGEENLSTCPEDLRVE